MGVCSSKDGSEIFYDDVKGLKEKIRLLREEVRGVITEMDKETKAHEKDMVVFAFKEASWKTEKKRLREEVKMLRKKVKESFTEIEEGNFGEKIATEWEMEGTPNTIFEQIQQERARRDEAVEKWKQLYHAIKIELDDLIQRTHNGDGLHWGATERTEALKTQLQAKEETIKSLKEQVVSMEQDKYKRNREIDILRQSLRIMTSKKEQQIETSHKCVCK
ncbi:golgin subfamily A member 6-like protein 2 [Cucumis melo var. makuwa]|uniref:Golgin subfamily A member 6-like protein 2 n=2 Tax=Cucumis melo TaxID=3656 RepID=A0A5D3BGY2_CUCMM|nr:golgin subfamily A member 6-like protein 2 [Cucumis melo var. makuwa]